MTPVPEGGTFSVTGSAGFIAGWTGNYYLPRVTGFVRVDAFQMTMTGLAS